MNKQWHIPHGIGNVNEWNIKCLGHRNETNTSSKMTCKQLWNPVDAWQGDVLIKCDAGRIQHDAVQSIISKKVQPKNPQSSSQKRTASFLPPCVAAPLPLPKHVATYTGAAATNSWQLWHVPGGHVHGRDLEGPPASGIREGRSWEHPTKSKLPS